MQRGPGRARWFAVATALVALTGGGATRASPEDIFGYGARSPGMGATGVAFGEGFETAYLNPALLSSLRLRKLSFGAQAATFALYAEGDGLPGRLDAAPAHGTLIGAALPLPLRGVLADRLGLGLAFYTPTDVIVRGRILYPETPQFPLLPDRAQSVTIRLGLGADLGYGLRVGAGFAALAEIAGTVLVAQDGTGRVATRVEDQLIATYAPVLGIAYDLPLPGSKTQLRVGAAYRGTLDARFAVTIDATKLSSIPIPAFNIAGLAQYDPAQLALEIAGRDAQRTFALGLTIKRWSKYPGGPEPTILCPGGGTDCGALQPPAIAYEDTQAVHIGLEQVLLTRRALALRGRGGLIVEPDPLPHQLPTSRAYDAAVHAVAEVPTRYFDATRIAITAGLGLEVPIGRVRARRANADEAAAEEGWVVRANHFSLDAFTQLHLLVPAHFTSMAASGEINPVGRAAGRVLVFGLVAGVEF